MNKERVEIVMSKELKSDIDFQANILGLSRNKLIRCILEEHIYGKVLSKDITPSDSVSVMNKTKQIKLTIDSDTYKHLADKANEFSISMSGYIRYLLFHAK